MIMSYDHLISSYFQFQKCNKYYNLAVNMSYFQRHLRNNENTQMQNRVVRQPANPTNVLRNYNKNNLRVKTQHSIPEPTKRSKQKDIVSNSILQQPRKSNNNQKNIKSGRKQIKMPTHNQSIDEPMRAILAQTDHSVQQMLNSSIKHFQKLLANQSRLNDQHSHLVQQNEFLKIAVNELRAILQEKLQKALRKQKEELGLVMSDYLCLITKLLADKEELTLSLQKVEQQNKKLKNQFQASKQEIQILKSREAELSHLNESIANQLESRQQSRPHFDEQELFQRLNTQQSKIKTLYQLLERTQHQKKVIQQAFGKLQKADDKYKLLEKQYLAKLQEIEKQHEEQFIEYEKAVRETIAKKDEKIEHLCRLLQNKTEEMEDSRLIISNVI